VKVPVPLLVKVTVPVGTVAPVAAVSVTVAVQEVAVPAATEAGVQATLVVVVCKRESTVTDTTVELVIAPFVPPVPVIVTENVPAVVPEKLHIAVVDSPAVRVTLAGHVTVRPVAGVVVLESVTIPAKPSVADPTGRLCTVMVEEPVAGGVKETDVGLAERLKPLN
jgi:hypothetical protein